MHNQPTQKPTQTPKGYTLSEAHTLLMQSRESR